MRIRLLTIALLIFAICSALLGCDEATPEIQVREQVDFDVILIETGDSKINVIKAVRHLREDLGLKEAKELVESAPIVVLEKVNKEEAEKAWDLLESEGAIAEMAIAGDMPGEYEAPAASDPEQEELYDLWLLEVGDSEIQVIKAVRLLREDLGLKEAKELVESAPIVVLEKVNKEEAEKAWDLLESEGATVQIEVVDATVIAEDASPSSDDELYDVILVEAGPNRMRVIMWLRAMISDYEKAIALVDGAPSIAFQGVDQNTADSIKETLDGAGAIIEFQASTYTLAGTPPPTDKPFLMPIEDVFTIRGRGTVVTGRVERGSIKPMEEVEIVGLREARKTVVTALEMFRKTLDYAQAGDNIGVLLRGIARDDVERGMVLAEPGSMQAHESFEADIYIMTRAEGGRHKPFFEGYRPQFHFGTMDVAGTIHLPESIEMVVPGDATTATIELNIPVAMEEGLMFAMREGGLTVGFGWVTQTLD